MRRRSAPALVPLVAATAALAFVACTDAEVGTTPYAHESPPLPPPPFVNVASARFLGGSGVDRIDDMIVDSDGTIFVVGGTASLDFPTTDGSTLDTSTPAGCTACPFDAFVAALAPDGTPRWIKLIASPGYDRLTAVVGVGTSIYVGGGSGPRAGLAGWHGGAAGERGEQDGLVCALARSDGALQGCRYLGGTGPGVVTDLAADPNGTQLIAGLTVVAGEALHLDAAYAAAFAGRHRATAAGADGVVVALSRDLTAADNLRWASYVGGSGDEGGTPSVWADGYRAYYLGETTSTDVPVPGGWLTTAPAGQNAFLAALSLDGTALTYGTYVGGNGDDRVGPGALAGYVDALFLGVTTTSTDMPALPGTPQRTYGGDGGAGCGDGDIWLAGTNVTWSGAPSLISASYLGGAAGERLGGSGYFWGLAGQRLLVTGHTFSSNFPHLNAAQPQLAGAPCTTTAGNADAFAAALTTTLSPTDGTFLGGGAFDRGSAIAGTTYGAVVAGETASSSFPTVGAVDATFGGADDGFVTVYGPPPWTPPGDGGVGPDDGGGQGTEAGGGFDDITIDDRDPANGCCGASTPTPGGLGLAGLVALLVARRRRRRR